MGCNEDFFQRRNMQAQLPKEKAEIVGSSQRENFLAGKTGVRLP